MDFTVVKDSSVSAGDTTVSVSNDTNGLCAVRVTKMSDGSVQYQSNLFAGKVSNQKTAFTFNILSSEFYMIEAWIYNGSTGKLVPTAVKYV